GELLEPLVERQEREARAKLGSVALRGEPHVVAAIDGEATRRSAGSVVWLAPGRHVVTFHPGTSAAREVAVTVDVGERREVSAPEPAPRAAPVAPPVAPPPAPRLELRRERPFGASVLYVAAGVSAASVLV